MEELTTEQYKLIELNLLKKFDGFCKEHKIEYCLAYGTLLGAIRHNGFIPWDDDIDIMMTRHEYDKFLSLRNDPKLTFGVISPEIDGNYYAPYCNIYDKDTLLIEEGNCHRGFNLGVKIDIFPFDKVPENNSNYNKLRRYSNWINKLMAWKRWPLSAYRSPVSFIRASMVKAVLLLVPYAFLQRMIAYNAKKRYLRDSGYCDNLCYNPYNQSKFPFKCFNTITHHQFEDCIFPIPTDYDLVLKSIYGDYMKLPPVEKRVTHHTFKVYKIK